MNASGICKLPTIPIVMIYSKLISERWYPYTVSTLITGVISTLFYFFDVPFSLNKVVLEASLTVTAIIAGFMSTNLVFLASFETRLIKLFQQTPHQWNALIGYFAHGVYWSLPFCLLALIGLGFETESPIKGQTFFFTAWVWLAIIVIALFHRSLRLLVALLRSKAHGRR